MKMVANKPVHRAAPPA